MSHIRQEEDAHQYTEQEEYCVGQDLLGCFTSHGGICRTFSTLEEVQERGAPAPHLHHTWAKGPHGGKGPYGGQRSHPPHAPSTRTCTMPSWEPATTSLPSDRNVPEKAQSLKREIVRATSLVWPSYKMTYNGRVGGLCCARAGTALPLLGWPQGPHPCGHAHVGLSPFLTLVAAVTAKL